MNDADPAPTPTPPPRRPRGPRPTVGKVAGELLITAGVLLLLFVVYEAFWTNIASGRLQDQAAQELEQQWDATPAVDPGDTPVPPPEAVEVLSPVPGDPWPPEETAQPWQGEPLERLLTLTTCHPEFSNAERLIAHAVLTETTSKATTETPTALRGR